MAAIIALSTSPDIKSAREIAAALIDARLAACVQIVPGIESFYRWQDKVENDSECQLVIKTTHASADAAFDLLCQLHPYDVPQWLTIDNVSGSNAYISWLLDEVAGEQ